MNRDEHSSHKSQHQANEHRSHLRGPSSDSDSFSDSSSPTRLPVRALSPTYTFGNRLIDFLDGFPAFTEMQKREIKDAIIEVIVMRIFRHQNEEGYEEAAQAISRLPSY